MDQPESGIKSGNNNVDLSGGLIRMGVEFRPISKIQPQPPPGILESITEHLIRMHRELVEIHNLMNSILYRLNHPWYSRLYLRLRGYLGF